MIPTWLSGHQNGLEGFARKALKCMRVMTYGAFKRNDAIECYEHLLA